jgi:hypothetical protein
MHTTHNMAPQTKDTASVYLPPFVDFTDERPRAPGYRARLINGLKLAAIVASVSLFMIWGMQ